MIGGITLSNLRTLRAAAAWPSAAGRVVRSEVATVSIRAGARSRGGAARVYEPLIEYAFTVGGRT